jgi:hypothetical protein
LDQDQDQAMTITGFKTVVKPSPQVIELKRLLDRWREPELQRVRSDLVVPDTSVYYKLGVGKGQSCNLALGLVL